MLSEIVMKKARSLKAEVTDSSTAVATAHLEWSFLLVPMKCSKHPACHDGCPGSH